MKTLIFLIFPLFTIAQEQPKMGAGLMMGYSSKKSLIGEMYFGFRIANNVNLYPICMKLHGYMSDVDMPVIYESKLSYRINSWEVYAGPAYHFIYMDNKEMFRKHGGLQPAAGIMYHINKVVISAGMSGEVYSVQLGFFNFK